MRFLIAVSLILIFSFVAGIFLPWWSIALVAFLVCLFLQRHLFAGFAAGFLAMFLLWGILALWIDLKNDSILSQKIAAVLPLGGSSLLLVLVTALAGGLVAGMAGLTGSALHSLIFRSPRSN